LGQAGGAIPSFPDEDLPWWLDVYADELTPGERVVFRAIVEGQSGVQIAHACRLALSTVRSHVKSIHRKLQVRSIAELQGLIVQDLAEQLSAPRTSTARAASVRPRRLMYMRYVAGEVGWTCRVCRVVRMFGSKALALKARHQHAREPAHLANGRRTRPRSAS
jgi:DNA-binding CsgD family transcriptional regulator